MVIKKGNINFLEGETEIKSQMVFLEKADQPNSKDGIGIPKGVLQLTNKRLFFLSKEKGDTKGLLKAIASTLAGEFTVSISDLIQYGARKLKERRGIDFKPFLNNENSFVIPVERIISCEKVGDRFITNIKKKFLLIVIADNKGSRANYCLYAKDPKNVLDPIDIGDWFDKFNEVKEINPTA